MASLKVTFKLEVYILEKKAVRDNMLPKTAYIRKNNIIKGTFIRSNQKARSTVNTPNISINGDSNS